MLRCLARIQETKAYVTQVLDAWRIALVPYVIYGGRNMSLLTSGVWVDSAEGPTSSIRAVYVSSLQQVLPYPLPSEPCLLGRWKWITATAGNLDMSDFFAGLRVAKSIVLTNKEAISLFIHQTGKIPDGPIAVMYRDGAEGTIEVL
jgi:hypothetical protein